MASRDRSNRYSLPPEHLLNRFSTADFSRNRTPDRVNKLSELSMSNYLEGYAKLKKRLKLKGQLSSADYLDFFPGDGHSRLVVSERKRGRVLVFPDGSKTGQELIGGVQPHGVACLDARTVVLVDESLNGDGSVIKVLSVGDDASSTGSVVAQWTNKSNTWQPRGVAVTKSGQIVVTNVHPNADERFWIYSADGQDSRSFGRAHGPGDLVFRSPSYVTTDDFGRILATDTDGDCVKIFDTRCRYTKEFGNGGNNSTAEKDSKLSRPLGLACDGRGNVIVCDSGNRRLAMFSQDGRFVQTLRQPQKIGLHPVDVGVNSSCDRLAFSVHNRTNGFQKLVSYNFVSI